MTPPTTPLLALAGVGLRLQGRPILAGIDLSVGAGEIVGLIGESGSGKSMLAYATIGLLPERAEREGRIVLDGVDLARCSEAELCARRGRDIGMIFQEPMTALNPVQTIGEQVMETVRIHGGADRAQAREVAQRTLARVGLPAGRIAPSRYPHELSGGQRQRVVIAMAIALRPRLLIADEPTTALDVTTQAQILALLRRLVAEDGMSLMLISHDLAVVADLADRLAILREGAIVETGPTREFFRRTTHPYTRALLAASGHRPVRQPSTATRTLLSVRHLVRSYPMPRTAWGRSRPPHRAVDDVSFELRDGESLGLVGESGCGKSTLARALLGLEPLQGGDIRLDGSSVLAGGRIDRRLRRRMQVVFQDPYGSFDPRQRVARLVAEPFHLLDAPPTGAARERAVAEALAQVGLQASDAGRHIHEFSGGQRQRIAIARALIIQPSLIVLDEAVSALDVSIRARILDLLADLAARFGLAYLFISHDLAVVRAITDRVLVMQAGRIVEHGPTERVFAEPQHEYTRSLIAASPRLELA